MWYPDPWIQVLNPGQPPYDFRAARRASTGAGQSSFRSFTFWPWLTAWRTTPRMSTGSESETGTCRYPILYLTTVFNNEDMNSDFSKVHKSCIFLRLWPCRPWPLNDFLKLIQSNSNNLERWIDFNIIAKSNTFATVYVFVLVIQNCWSLLGQWHRGARVQGVCRLLPRELQRRTLPEQRHRSRQARTQRERKRSHVRRSSDSGLFTG